VDYKAAAKKSRESLLYFARRAERLHREAASSCNGEASYAHTREEAKFKAIVERHSLKPEPLDNETAFHEHNANQVDLKKYQKHGNSLDCRRQEQQEQQERRHWSSRPKRYYPPANSNYRIKKKR